MPAANTCSASSYSEWSVGFDTLFNDLIANPIKNDIRSAENNIFGYSADEIKASVLRWGRADFTKPHSANGHAALSEKDKCTLYCYFNFRSHFHSSKWIFSHFLDTDDQFTMIDIGAGPYTSYFSFAESFRMKPINYIAIDHAPWMSNIGQQLNIEAKRRNLISAQSRVFHYNNWNKDALSRHLSTTGSLIINFSYFFANPSLSDDGLIQDLATLVLDTKQRIQGQRIYISYADSPRSIANKRYLKFLQALGYDSACCEKHAVEFKNRLSFSRSYTRTNEFEYEFFELDL